MKQFSSASRRLGRGWISLVAFGLIAAATGCSGAESISGDAAGDAAGDANGDEAMDDAGELGQAQQPLQAPGYWPGFDFRQSCFDPSGTDSVLAAIAVSTATELGRWKSGVDLQVSFGTLKLTSAGKARCDDGKCFNTQALLDLQNSPAGKVQIRPGVNLDPAALRVALTKSHDRQAKCVSVLGIPLFGGCKISDHELEFMHSEPGACDTNYWFEVLTPQGAPYPSLKSLKKQLLFVDIDNNSYIQFQTNGAMVGIDPTYGLNEVGSTSSGSCSASCVMVSSTDLRGDCCSCNGTKKFSRSAWNVNTYLCQ